MDSSFDDVCVLCQCRIANWVNQTGKTKVIKGKVIHLICLTDYKLRHGKDYEEVEDGLRLVSSGSR